MILFILIDEFPYPPRPLGVRLVVFLAKKSLFLLKKSLLIYLDKFLKIIRI